ncbi:uncharacterized protein [Montipora capricornis]|uniref:uncharacterized protein n=1 Tax=Montipora capricornis TaxID=246305 RepID=UPI0035F1264E
MTHPAPPDADALAAIAPAPAPAPEPAPAPAPEPVLNPMEDVKKDFEAVKSKLSQNTVAHALQNIGQLLSRPPGAFDAHATMAALEHLVDTARENADAEILRYNAILRQTRGLAENPALQRVLLKFLGSKEEIAIDKEIDKATKSYSPTPTVTWFSNGCSTRLS